VGDASGGHNVNCRLVCGGEERATQLVAQAEVGDAAQTATGDTAQTKTTSVVQRLGGTAQEGEICTTAPEVKEPTNTEVLVGPEDGQATVFVEGGSGLATIERVVSTND
ncbi:hypothetical protein U1Q18_010773, partial [Sarracenia purpurea var. burkii]